VAEEAEKDPPAVDLFDPDINDEGYAGVTDPDTVEGSHVEDPLHNEERAVIRFLSGYNFEFISHDKNFLAFRQANRSRPSYLSRRVMPRACVRMLLDQVAEKVEEHPAVTGLMIPSRGYVELICSRLSAMTADRAFRLGLTELNCIHKDPDYSMPSLPFRWPNEDGQSFKRVHLSGTADDPCVEISNASPLAMLFFGRTFESSRARLAYRQIPFLGTLKIAYSAAFDRDRLARKGEEIARSLIYELNVRNGVIVELDAPAAGPDLTAARLAPEVSDRIRYPRTKVQHEISSLFGFASQAADDPPMAFLSYYQALEYFIPAAIRQSAIKDIRRELRDPSFDEANSDSLLRILRAAEGSISVAEPNQLRILVNEYARASRLEEFFSPGWGDYFTRKGPIKGVAPISLRDASQSLSNQVADRVYQIRNRIVHAKDDPRYGSARVLLPRSAESNVLTPDVLLVRLLATEAIAASQVL
jgi:hypothetical protein